MIRINFASRNYRLVGRIRIGLICGSIILVVMTAGLLWTTVTLRATIFSVDRTLQELEAADEQVRPLFEERERLVKDLTAMSGLIESKKISWTQLLTSIEAVVPKGVALKRVELSPKDSTLTLSGITRSPKLLHNMVVAMEGAASFKDPFLKHQSLDKGSISFNVVAVYQKDAYATVAKGKQ
jgi:Tfp pilus assembly protein PilN